MIKRQNILDLLGGDSKKYHSCIITSYSFDVMFFERAVLPKLSKAGITNINILVDAGMFEKQLSSFSGKEYLDRRYGYSVTPIKMNAAFHPKLLLAVGKTKGFLAVGSGNLTGSGLSFNEEIWGTLFYKVGHENSTAIFSQVKYYLQNLKPLVKGVNYTKLEWLETFSPWYKKLRPQLNGVTSVGDEKVSLLTSFGDRSFFNEIILPLSKEPESIKILSPFYNKNGQFLKDLIDVLQPKSFHCIVNSEMGSLPLNFKNNFIKFTDWSSFAEDGKRHPNLHAKAIQISYEDKTYFILGSANATKEAFGNQSNNTSNAEAILFIKSSRSKDYFEDLGVDFSGEGTLDIESFSIKEKEEDSEDETFVFENYIQLVEIKSNFIIMYFSKFVDGDCSFIIEDGDGERLNSIEVQINGGNLEINIKTPIKGDPFRCYLNNDEKRISNYGYFHNVNLLLKTNPDERLSRFNDLKQHAFFDDLEMELFLDFLSDEGVFHRDSSATKRAVPNKNNVDDNSEKETVSSEEFNKHSEEIGSNSSHEIHISTNIEDFLTALNFEVADVEDELSDNIEETESNEEDGGSHNGTVSHHSVELSYSDGKRIKRKLQRILISIEEYVINAFLHNDSNIGVKPINAILIGFNLMLKYWYKEINRKSCSIYFTYSDINALKKLEGKFNLDRQSSQINSSPNEVAYFADVYLLEDIKTHVEKNGLITLKKLDEVNLHVESSRYFNTSISDINEVDGAGSFLIKGYCHVLQYIKEVESKKEAQNEVWVEQKTKLLDLMIIVISSCTWSRRSQIIKELIALNTFWILDFQLEKEDLKLQLLAKLNALGDDFILDDLKELLDLYSRYQKFMNQIKTNINDLKQELNSFKVGSLIFSQTYGFGQLDFVYTNKEINIITPLGDYNNKTKVYGYSKKYIGQNAKYFHLE